DGTFSNTVGGLQPVFNNAGTFRKSFGNGITRIAAVFNNDGVVDVQAMRTLALAGGGRSTGTFTIAAGGAVNFDSGGNTYLLHTGTTITGAGFARVTGPILLVDAAVTVDNFESAYDGLTFSPSGHLVVTTTFNWTYGLISGLGSLDIGSGAALNINGPQG